jgi:predicted amidohydrolase
MMRIALAQIVSTPDPERNMRTVAHQTRKAAASGAQLVLFPEATMIRLGTDLARVAEPLDGPWAESVRKIAADTGVTIVAGMFTPASDGRVHNTLLATGNGVEAAYDKIHLYDAFGFTESETVAPGSKPVTFEVDGVTIGLTLCYDLRFPGLFHALANSGAQLILNAASWAAGPGKRDQWDLLLRARALDSTSLIAACDQGAPRTIGLEPGKAPTGIGASAIAGPHGTLLHQLQSRPGLLVRDLDLKDVDTARTALPLLANRHW